jgi:hypothetical protein
MGSKADQFLGIEAGFGREFVDFVKRGEDIGRVVKTLAGS